MGTVDREVKLRSAAQSLRRSGVIILVLLAIGAVVIGVGVSRHQTCTTTTIAGYALPDCTTETDVSEATFTAAAIFFSGLLLYYPLYFHLSILSEAVADLLAEVDDEEYPPPPSTS